MQHPILPHDGSLPRLATKFPLESPIGDSSLHILLFSGPRPKAWDESRAVPSLRVGYNWDLKSGFWAARTSKAMEQWQTIPMSATVRRTRALAACLAAGILAVCWHSETKAAGSWDQKAAAAYLDQREAWWMEWPKAARDREPFCVSCHTAVPYALSRPALRSALGEKAPA